VANSTTSHHHPACFSFAQCRPLATTRTRPFTVHPTHAQLTGSAGPPLRRCPVRLVYGLEAPSSYPGRLSWHERVNIPTTVYASLLFFFFFFLSLSLVIDFASLHTLRVPFVSFLRPFLRLLGTFCRSLQAWRRSLWTTSLKRPAGK